MRYSEVVLCANTARWTHADEDVVAGAVNHRLIDSKVKELCLIYSVLVICYIGDECSLDGVYKKRKCVICYRIIIFSTAYCFSSDVL